MTKQDVLNDGRIEGNVFFLPEGELDRKLYLDVSNALVKIGGKWNRKAKGFVFPQDPAELLGRVKSGEKVNLKKEFQAFYTPSVVAGQVADIVSSDGTPKVLEPSAGDGALVDAVLLLNPDAIITLNASKDIPCRQCGLARS